MGTLHITSTESKSFSRIMRKLAFVNLEASFLNYITLHYNRDEGADTFNELRLQTRSWCLLQHSGCKMCLFLDDQNQMTKHES